MHRKRNLTMLWLSSSPPSVSMGCASIYKVIWCDLSLRRRRKRQNGATGDHLFNDSFWRACWPWKRTIDIWDWPANRLAFMHSEDVKRYVLSLTLVYTVNRFYWRYVRARKLCLLAYLPPSTFETFALSHIPFLERMLSSYQFLLVTSAAVMITPQNNESGDDDNDDDCDENGCRMIHQTEWVRLGRSSDRSLGRHGCC